MEKSLLFSLSHHLSPSITLPLGRDFIEELGKFFSQDAVLQRSIITKAGSSPDQDRLQYLPASMCVRSGGGGSG